MCVSQSLTQQKKIIAIVVLNAMFCTTVFVFMLLCFMCGVEKNKHKHWGKAFVDNGVIIEYLSLTHKRQLEGKGKPSVRARGFLTSVIVYLLLLSKLCSVSDMKHNINCVNWLTFFGSNCLEVIIYGRWDCVDAKYIEQVRNKEWDVVGNNMYGADESVKKANKSTITS